MLTNITFFCYVCWESSWRISPFCIYIVAQLYSCFKIFPLVQFELSTHWFAADMSFDLFLSDSCIVTWAHCNSYPCSIQNWMVATPNTPLQLAITGHPLLVTTQPLLGSEKLRYFHCQHNVRCGGQGTMLPALGHVTILSLIHNIVLSCVAAGK